MSQATKKLRKLNRFWFIWNIIESVILLAGGVLAIVAGVMAGQNGTANQGIENAIAYSVAGFVILDGILRIVMYLARLQKDEEQSPLVIAGFEVSMGVLLVLLQSHFADAHIFTYTVVNLIAIILMVMGVLLMVYAIYVIAKKFAKLFMPIVEILFAAILIGVGIVIEVLYNTADARDQLVLIMTGSILCLAAIGMFIITLVTRAKAKKELDKAEAEEQGDYQIEDSARRKRKEETHYQPEVIDAETIDPVVNEPEEPGEEPQNLSGPRAIENHGNKE